MSTHMDVSGVIKLLDSKKRCLQRYLEMSENFLVTAEAGDLTELPDLELRRDAVIRALGMYDRKLQEVVSALPLDQRSPELIQAVRNKLDEEALIIQAILRADNRLMACIEREKQRIKREMNANQKSKEITNRFKSTWMPESGEGLDQKL